MISRTITQEQEQSIHKMLYALEDGGRIRAEGTVRIYSVPNRDSMGFTEIRGAERLAEWMQASDHSLMNLKVKTIGNCISKALCKMIGPMYARKQRMARGRKQTIQRMAQAELKRRLGQMSVAELATLAKQ